MCLDNPFRHHRSMCLMQDGVASHTAHTTLSLLQGHRVNVLPWSSKSPDLNPIKHNVMSSVGWLEDGALPM